MFIKILNKQIAARLKKAGFSYTTEICKQDGEHKLVYCFATTKEFYREFEKVRPGSEVVYENKMRF